MLGHDRNDSRTARLALLLLAALGSAPARAEEPAAPMSLEVVRLSGDRVTRWADAQGASWVLLEGSAAALQGGEGLRADAILVRVERAARRNRTDFEIEVYAEGNVRTTDPDAHPSQSRRLTLATNVDPKLSAFGSATIAKLAAAPAKLAIRDRGYPTKAVAEPPPRPVETEHTIALGEPVPEVVPASRVEEAKRDPMIRRAQDDGGGFGPPAFPAPRDDEMDDPARPKVVPGEPFDGGIPDLEALPDAPPEVGAGAAVPAPLLPDSRRRFTVSGGPNFQVEQFPTESGEITFILRGGVNLVADLPKDAPKGPGGKPLPGPVPYMTVDLSADNMVIWTRRSAKSTTKDLDPKSGIQQDADEPLQIYMEGNVSIRQDKREVAGKGDETVFTGERAYYDLRTERLLAHNGRIYTAAPGLLAPLRTDARVINQYREDTGRRRRDGSRVLSQFIRVDGTTTTGSRFPIPGYRFDSQSVEIEDVTVPLVDETTGGKVGPGLTPDQQDKLFEFRAFNNAYYLGQVPIFYLPYTRFTSDFDPILRNIRFQTGNVFGQQVQFDLSAFRLLGIRKPNAIDNWNFDVDYLSYRGVALGTELSWFGRDPIGDVIDPYGKRRLARDVDMPYFGYLDLWGLRDGGRDILGPGPAVVTNGPPNAGKAGFQRTSVPAFQEFRGRATLRHMQRLLGDDAPDDEDLRIQFEASYLSDRNFLEEYYKRLFDAGLDQETLVYGIRQKQNRALTILAEANLQDWYTESQWLPKVEYTRLGDSPALLNDWVNISMRAGADYANTHTAVEVNNPNIFAYIPFDPVSNTSQPLRTGRIYTAGEVDVPLNIGPSGFEFLKVIPYAQGQLVGWDNQLGFDPLGRAWGAYGLRANITAWRTFDGPFYESELLNVHGLAHKMNFQVDYRNAFSNQPLSRIGVQDDLDDNTYEWTRRYFALTNYVGGLLPPQYDPRLLTLRRLASPITGTTDIQDTIQTVHMGFHQRLQTKRGPEGRRRIIDYMVLDLDTTYFPIADRDNFGKPFGQNTYNFEWYVGDRTSFVSYGWFEFWDVQGQAIVASNPRHTNDPFGLNVITSGFSFDRPPRGNVFFGYSIINTGPIATSALNVSFTYWLSPKWYAYASTSYDFGNAILLGTTFSITKITKDYLTSVGLTVDPQRDNYAFAFEISPRFSPNVRIGSTAGTRFDSRFAPSQ